MSLLKENGLMIFLIVLILGGGLVMSFFSDSGSGSSLFPKVVEPTEKPTEEVEEADFEKEGNLVKQSEEWILVYEEPGKPALTVILDFATCSDCKPEEYEQGMRVEVKGNKEKDRLEVIELIKLDAD